jgi:hypothetical protein
MKADQLETRIENPPGLIETYAYGLFFAGTLVGPQFTLQKFRKFVGGQFLDPQNGQVRSSRYLLSTLLLHMTMNYTI